MNTNTRRSPFACGKGLRHHSVPCREVEAGLPAAHATAGAPSSKQAKRPTKAPHSKRRTSKSTKLPLVQQKSQRFACCVNVLILTLVLFALVLFAASLLMHYTAEDSAAAYNVSATFSVDSATPSTPIKTHTHPPWPSPPIGPPVFPVPVPSPPPLQAPILLKPLATSKVTPSSPFLSFPPSSSSPSPMLRPSPDAPTPPAAPPRPSWPPGIIDRLNAQFREGHPSNHLEEAGVAVRVLDDEEDHQQPWTAGASRFSDRFSISIVNARHPDIYQGPVAAQTHSPGFVLSPAVQSRMSCGYPKDGQTTGLQCRTPGGDKGCKPGCARNVCGVNGRRWNCHWPASQLKELMELQDSESGTWGHREYSHDVYNEIILDTHRRPWAMDLPSAIDAIFVQVSASAEEKYQAIQIHGSFLAAYLNHPEATAVPLLLFDKTSVDAPFSLFLRSPPPLALRVAPPPPLSKHDIVATLNARFTNAKPSNDLSQAGVVIRAWDGLSAPGRPWEPCEAGQFCQRFSDRFATSIVYPGHPETYAPGGFVLRPEALELNCAYYADGGSQGAQCNPPRKTSTCSPGCKRWCDPARGAKNWGCAWRPEYLKSMIEQQQVLSPGGGYNEVIFDAEAWVRNLPRTIMAVFVAKDASEEDIETSRSVHANFLQRFGIDSDTTPLVTYDAKAAITGAASFALYSHD